MLHVVAGVLAVATVFGVADVGVMASVGAGGLVLVSMVLSALAFVGLHHETSSGGGPHHIPPWGIYASR